MDYIRLYKEARKQKGDIDESLKKIAKKNGLTKDQHQRLVEVTNIQTFLGKLANGTQANDFTLATPIAPEKSEIVKSDNGALSKVAAYSIDHIPEDYFRIKEDTMPTLPKVAMSASNDSMYVDPREEIAKQELKKVASAESEAMDSMREGQMEDSLTIAMVDAFKNDQTLIKCALAYATVAGDDDFSELLMMDTNLTKDEIMLSEVNDENLAKFAAKKTKVRRDFKKALATAGVLGLGVLGAKTLEKHQEVGDRRIVKTSLPNQYRRKD